MSSSDGTFETVEAWASGFFFKDVLLAHALTVWLRALEARCHGSSVHVRSPAVPTSLHSSKKLPAMHRRNKTTSSLAAGPDPEGSFGESIAFSTHRLCHVAAFSAVFDHKLVAPSVAVSLLWPCCAWQTNQLLLH